MNIDRVRKLEKFRKEDPDDPFLIYALATEWMNENIHKSKQYFDELLEHYPDYLGTYYHAANLYITFGDRQAAEKIFQDGIALATKLEDQKTLSELTNAFNAFLYDD